MRRRSNTKWVVFQVLKISQMRFQVTWVPLERTTDAGSASSQSSSIEAQAGRTPSGPTSTALVGEPSSKLGRISILGYQHLHHAAWVYETNTTNTNITISTEPTTIIGSHGLGPTESTSCPTSQQQHLTIMINLFKQRNQELLDQYLTTGASWGVCNGRQVNDMIILRISWQWADKIFDIGERELDCRMPQMKQGSECVCAYVHIFLVSFI